jgi:hypothetical protein
MNMREFGHLKKEGGIVKEGELHYMSDLIRDPLSHKLKDTLLNTNQDFIFTYRGREPKEILNYLMGIGIPFQLPPKDNLKFKIKYPSKEIKNQREFKELMEGQQKTRAKIKSILNSMSDEYKLKTVEDLEKRNRVYLILHG